MEVWRPQVAMTPVAGRYAFVTSSAWTPGAQGIASADALCQSEAGAARLPGTYMALLAPTGASAAARFSSSGLPWIRPDGIPLASTADAFFSASLLDVPPNVTADGFAYFGNMGVWSGAARPANTGADATNCANWTSSSATAKGEAGAAGDSTANSFFNMFGTIVACNATWMSLACLQE